jgi:4-amino-4-deoxy-L-arabinose transferase-like glycosyltransferase
MDKMQILRTYRTLFLLVLLTRLGMVWYVYPDVERIYNGDSHLYEQYAMSMLETGTYLADGYGTAGSDPFADMIRPPGLPVVIALVYGVFGVVVGPWVVSILSALMSLVACIPDAGVFTGCRV